MDTASYGPCLRLCTGRLRSQPRPREKYPGRLQTPGRTFVLASISALHAWKVNVRPRPPGDPALFRNPQKHASDEAATL